jgi:hypothetical protein
LPAHVGVATTCGQQYGSAAAQQGIDAKIRGKSYELFHERGFLKKRMYPFERRKLPKFNVFEEKFSLSIKEQKRFPDGNQTFT